MKGSWQAFSTDWDGASFTEQLSPLPSLRCDVRGESGCWWFLTEQGWPEGRGPWGSASAWRLLCGGRAPTAWFLNKFSRVGECGEPGWGCDQGVTGLSHLSRSLWLSKCIFLAHRPIHFFPPCYVFRSWYCHRLPQAFLETSAHEHLLRVTRLIF